MEGYKNILIIEDELLIAQDLSYLVEDLGFKCIGIAKNYERAMFLFNTNDVHLILCDINIEGDKDGIETVFALNKIKKIPVIYLSAYSDQELIKRITDSSTFGYLVKPYNERSLEVAINMAINKFYQNEFKAVNKDFLSNFTSREIEIIKLLAAGKSSLEIADILFISPQTVSKHRSNILKKSGCKSSTELIHHYYQ
ncbi:response regulator transcription factor [Marivirga salinae]|uniref:Response regulator transcription factor n=1 Tax=Marivirga salinarum TaxID=3059078 RepID=A0AA49JGK2_9BACT|nr:response regulator transcription factor [Marivirga sp. BDSF4-3]WKK74440.2 response regulator transcription factor [Marivirga sp. BDSF4-3]